MSKWLLDGARARVRFPVPTKNSVRIAMAALADPLLRILGAVDRREALTHADGE